jgi:hypothetical protein
MDEPYTPQLTQLSNGAEVAIFVAVACLLGYMAWVIIREVYVRLAIWAEERDEGVPILFCKRSV